MKTLKERLKYAMNETGFHSQTALAKAAGIRQSAVSKILNGTTEVSRSTGKLAAAMGISADWLINGSGSLYGTTEEPAPRVDVSHMVKLYDANGYTGESIAWPRELPGTCCAYAIQRDTGIAQAPGGSIVIVDTAIKPAANSLVAVKEDGAVTVYRSNKVGQKIFLSVDSDRLPMIEAGEGVDILGVITQLFVTNVSR
ncbi:LexA family transcriptional regulator [Klebsiella variicola]|uniref:helix-turn-helix domain-containing protein n=1 Tax=Klebsiella TaxID=570 RepID=UPI001C227F64|nr:MULTISPECIES: LexA family transcriptional regulator [Klebsiella]EIY5055144.1 LexA family transcriptional regulator [Klebsiella variicola]MCD9775841.1 LexA family transcriptional regulator [Klebsiella variicola subsp. variicola]QXA73924.1 LexA family transcriptional regulator [Klebsiella aerogenes]